MSQRTRVRQGRAYHMDVALREAVRRNVIETGWDDVTYVSVAEQAGVTTRPIYDRYPHRSEFGADAAARFANPSLARALTRLLDAGLATDRPFDEQVADAVEAFARFVQPDPDLFVALEFVAAAHVDPLILSAMTQGEMAQVLARCQVSESVSETDAAAAVLLVMRALGLLMLHTREAASQMDLTPDVTDLLAALRHPAEPVEVPNIGSPQLRDIYIEDPDPSEVALLKATLLEVAEVGYHGATISRICARGNVTRGLLFGRYPAKVELFLAATARTNATALQENMERNVAASVDLGPGVADAAQVRDWMHPEHALGRSLMIEQVRLSWRDPIMAGVLRAAEAEITDAVASELRAPHRSRVPAHVHWLLAVGAGAPLAAVLLPDAWLLPMSGFFIALDRGPVLPS